MNGPASAIKILIVVCIVLFALTLVPGLQRSMFEYLALYFPQNENFRIWQFVTNIFMHGGLAHIFFQHVCVVGLRISA